MGHPDIVALAASFEQVEADARRLIASTNESTGIWQPHPGAWSVAECLDHLATANRVYLAAMRPAAERAEAEGRLRRRPARPGFIGGLFAWSLEPPVTRAFKLPAPRKIRPRHSPPLADAAHAFLESHRELRAFLREFAAIDLASVRFPNPFIRGVRFSLATGLHVLAAHERRHLWQGWRVREAATAGAVIGPA